MLLVGAQPNQILQMQLGEAIEKEQEQEQELEDLEGMSSVEAEIGEEDLADPEATLEAMDEEDLEKQLQE